MTSTPPLPSTPSTSTATTTVEFLKLMDEGGGELLLQVAGSAAAIASPDFGVRLLDLLDLLIVVSWIFSFLLFIVISRFI